MKQLGLAGWSGSGKTTLVVKLIPELTARGIRVSTMKHAHHSFDIDQPGKDSFEHRAAGATEVLVYSSRRWALIHERETVEEASPEQLIPRMSPVDLLIIEGFKFHTVDKLEVHRPALGKPLLYIDDPNIVAIASDQPLDGVTRPVLDLNRPAAIAEFIIDRCGLKPAEHGMT